jgi:uncharacterized protein (TIGR03437 family)
MHRLSRWCLVSVCLFFILVVPARAQQETVTVTYQGPVRIPDDDDDGIVLPVLVNRAVDITKVTVTVEIEHPNIGDLEIRLVNPTGRTRVLADMHCNGTRNLSNFTFETSAGTRFGDFCPTQAGQTAAPREEIDTWGGDTSLGTWELQIKDDRDGGVGFLLNYTLRITGTRAIAPTFNVNTIFDTASGRANAITPGELIWIYGTALGPLDGVEAEFNQQGQLPTTLAGVTVTFDGIAAPLIFASFNALLVQVPNELAGRSATSIVVNYQNVASTMVAKVVVAASPGLYTRGGAGVGQLTALNPDGTRNSAANPVERNTYVVVYANGLGLVNPGVATGQRAPFTPLSMATFPITASIGGQPAQVLYAGLAPGFVGLFQLNIAVPANASTGVVPLTLTINGVPSQDNVFIAVR